MQDIHDIEPPVPVGMDPFLIQLLIILAVVLAVLALGLLLFFYLKCRKRNQLTQNTLLLPPPLPPDQAAMKAMNALADTMDKDPRQYYFGISAILKIFMGKVFNVGFPEMTTREVVANLAGLDLDRELTARTRDFFQFAAMVKYAGITPEAPRIRRDHDLVLTFIRDTSGNPVETALPDNKAVNPAENHTDRKDNGRDKVPCRVQSTGGAPSPSAQAHRFFVGKGK